MKIASLRTGARDGRLAIVSSDLTRSTDASFLVATLQGALDNWDRLAAHLEALGESLDHGAVPADRFHEHAALSPLPRAFRHVSNGALAASDGFAAPRGAIRLSGAEAAIGVTVITGDVPQGASRAEAAECILLFTLTAAMAGGQAAFSPVAVTPGELGAAWHDRMLNLPLTVTLDGKPETGPAQMLDFASMAAQAAAAGPLGAGTLLSAVNTVSIRKGSLLRLSARDSRGHSIFGAIELQS